MQKSNSLYSVIAALAKAELSMEIKRWSAVNEYQKMLVDFISHHKSDIINLTGIKTLASTDYTQLTNFLKKNGFSIEIKSFGSDSFGVTTSQNILIEWLQMGLATQVLGNDKHEYPAVRLKKGVQFFKVNWHNYPVARIETKNGDYVWITIEDFPSNNFELIFRAQGLYEEAKETDDYDELVVPMIDFSHKQQLVWLYNMEGFDKNGKKYIITQANQQNILKMNEIGAHAKSGTAIVLSRSVGNPYIVNRPFLVWIKRPGIQYPIFTAYVTTEFWKNPGLII
jgi:hypothetical protein